MDRPAPAPPSGPVTFADLLAEPGVEEVLELRSTFGFLAFHGGSLERATDVVAREAARRSGSSLYAVIQPSGLRRHLPSTDVRPDASPSLAAFLRHVRVAVAVHGYGRDGFWTRLLLGGSNRPLASDLARELTRVLPDYEVVDALEEIPKELRGIHPRNPVNLPAEGGVQLELPPRVRGNTPQWAGWEGPGLPPPTESLVAGLAATASSWARRRPAP
jgi:phage replication-related protein YjqB (UPF0714/DUF867 family)